ncbi:ComEA family DNA-binding protein [Paenibacillus gorillae]|uniref:ComEA family DNA-binding protein n=1 Tax=Paenibacillus gorillae TaxID=1243662 RepID=UPI0004B1E109|nr:ComEA family DNA-binding protein [Paenibacillus gorillae]
MKMKMKMARRTERTKLYILAALFVLAAVMFTVAFALPKEEEARGWLPLNRSVEQALLELEPGSLKDQKGGAQAGGEHSAVKGRTGAGEDISNGGKAQAGASEDVPYAEKAPSGTEIAPHEGGTGGVSSGQPGIKGSGDVLAAGGNEDAVEKPVKGQETAGSDTPGSADEDRGKLDVNRATAEQLKGLKGIGPAKAQAIVNEREQHGFFSSADDLLRVKGIGPKLLAGMKDSIVARP